MRKTNKWFENGERAYEKGYYGKAFYWFKKAAQQGNHKAMKRLGDMYIHGRSVKKDDARALDWYREAAWKGDGEASYLFEQMIHAIELSI